MFSGGYFPLVDYGIHAGSWSRRMHDPGSFLVASHARLEVLQLTSLDGGVGDGIRVESSTAVSCVPDGTGSSSGSSVTHVTVMPHAPRLHHRLHSGQRGMI